MPFKYPKFGGNTGDLLNFSGEEIYYATWTSVKEQFFKTPAGVSCKMRCGENVLIFVHKDECIRLVVQLKFRYGIEDCKIFLQKKDPQGTIKLLLLYPNDSTFATGTSGKGLTSETLAKKNALSHAQFSYDEGCEENPMLEYMREREISGPVNIASIREDRKVGITNHYQKWLEKYGHLFEVFDDEAL